MCIHLSFAAVDVETANADMASICQIGIALYQDGRLKKEWSSLINPDSYFDYINIAIHGITEKDVAGAPTFPDVIDNLRQYLNNQVCVCHTHFDRVSLERASHKYNISQIETTWLDSARVARRTWEQCARSGYGLARVCEIIGYEFKHHDALEDAKAAGQIILSAHGKTGLDVSAWLERVKQPINPSASCSSSKISKQDFRFPSFPRQRESSNLLKRLDTRFHGYDDTQLISESLGKEGNSEGELYGEILVFTGVLSITRREAADLAASIGCTVASGITKKTSLLVVGDQDIKKLAGRQKSSKHIKAEELILKGQQIRIIKESDFKQLVLQAQKNND